MRRQAFVCVVGDGSGRQTTVLIASPVWAGIACGRNCANRRSLALPLVATAASRTYVAPQRWRSAFTCAADRAIGRRPPVLLPKMCWRRIDFRDRHGPGIDGQVAPGTGDGDVALVAVGPRHRQQRSDGRSGRIRSMPPQSPLPIQTSVTTVQTNQPCPVDTACGNAPAPVHADGARGREMER